MSTNLKHSNFIRNAARVCAVCTVMVLLAACQSGSNPLDLGLGKKETKPEPEKIDVAILRAYCPKITLRSGTAFYNTYEKGGEQDPDRIIYQAAATDVTRDCQINDGTLTLNVAMAGRVVPGPKGQPGTITMPIRVAVVRGDEVLYSNLYKHDVNIGSTATTFVFSDPNIVIEQPTARNIQIFIGYDEGPYNTP